MGTRLKADRSCYHIHVDESLRGIHVQLLTHSFTNECVQLPTGEVPLLLSAKGGLLPQLRFGHR